MKPIPAGTEILYEYKDKTKKTLEAFKFLQRQPKRKGSHLTPMLPAKPSHPKRLEKWTEGNTKRGIQRMNDKSVDSETHKPRKKRGEYSPLSTPEEEANTIQRTPPSDSPSVSNIVRRGSLIPGTSSGIRNPFVPPFLTRGMENSDSD
jgi:hypothetical protein